jgi:ankyrin repeat protein
LHKAVRSGNIQIVRLLIEMGADLLWKGSQGTPKELAHSLVSLGSSRIDIYKLLGMLNAFLTDFDVI